MSEEVADTEKVKSNKSIIHPEAGLGDILDTKERVDAINSDIVHILRKQDHLESFLNETADKQALYDLAENFTKLVEQQAAIEHSLKHCVSKQALHDQFGEIVHTLEIIVDRQDKLDTLAGNTRAATRVRAAATVDNTNIMANEALSLHFLGNDITIFKGDSGESALAWLDTFNDRCLDLPARSKLTLFVKKLGGLAKFWYRDLLPAHKATFFQLENAFRAKYVNEQRTFFTEKELSQRTMRSNESFEDYLLDIRRLCQKLQKSEQDTVSRVIMGVKSSMRPYLIHTFVPFYVLGAY